jgi:hypothetical protein
MADRRIGRGGLVPAATLQAGRFWTLIGRYYLAYLHILLLRSLLNEPFDTVFLTFECDKVLFLSALVCANLRQKDLPLDGRRLLAIPFLRRSSTPVFQS